MKRFLVFLAVLMLSPVGVFAKSLTNGSGLAPTTDKISEAVVKVDDELDAIYTYLNDLYSMQASTSAPTVKTTNDLWLDTTTAAAPLLKFWDGSAWSLVANGSGFTGGLTLDSASVGLSENMSIERDTTGGALAKSVMLNASTVLPATVEIGGNLLQVTSKITLDTSAIADGTYYIYPLRTGTTSAFTLAYAASKNGTDHYIGEMTIYAYFPARVISYDSYEYQRTAYPLGLFHAVGTNTGAMVGGYSSAQTYVGGVINNYDGALVTRTLVSNRTGWWEVNATMFGTHTSAVSLGCIALYKGAVLAADSCQGGYSASGNYYVSAKVSAYIHLYVGEEVEVKVLANPGATLVGVSGANFFQNAFWGRWLGKAL